MENTEIVSAKKELKNKIKSLRNDYSRAFIDITSKRIQPSPFPITMFVMSVVDYFSSLLAGWSKSDRSLGHFQTTRMVDFCQNELGYGSQESRTLVKIYRHSLMHTSDPKVIRDNTANITIGWSISDVDSKHMSLQPYPNLPSATDIRLLHIGIKNLIDDLDNFVKSPRGFLDRLSKERTVQNNFESCKQEISNQQL